MHAVPDGSRRTQIPIAMPFLRRRGNAGSESDMRRHTILDSLPVPPANGTHSRPGSATDLPVLVTTPEDGEVPISSVSPSPVTPVTPATPVMPTVDLEPTMSSTAPQPTGDPVDHSLSPSVPAETPKSKRFSMLRFRNASDSQLAAKAKLQAASEKPPPLPRPPEIITTAPTLEPVVPKRRPSRMGFSSRFGRKSGEHPMMEQVDETNEDRTYQRRKNVRTAGGDQGGKQITFDDPRRPVSSHHAPPAYGDESTTTLALPINRLSESSRSDASSGDRVYGTTTTTTHTVHTTTTFFRLPRRKPKQPESLFPIAHLQKKNLAEDSDMSTSSHVAEGSNALARSRSTTHLTPTPSRPSTQHGATTPPTGSSTLFSKSSSPATALFRPSSRNSGRASPTRAQLHRRGRSSTLSSLGKVSPRESAEDYLAPPATARASMSTGRKSFGDLLGLGRLRQNSSSTLTQQGAMTPITPGSGNSKNNSIQLPRDSIILPERREDDTPGKYLERLLEVVSRSVIAAIVSKGTDQFSQAVLRSYMRSFRFFEDPMDMAIRKLLMEAELPKETQQIDRTLQAFANRYHECNPGIYATADQAYFIAFSLLILHTDVFNKNNKHKMQKADYLKNTRGEGVFDEILEVFYDNITYTPFIHVEDDLDINGERIIAHKAKKKSIFPHTAPDPAKRVAKEPIDPYTLIIDNKLDILRPTLRDVMHLEDPYSYLGTARTLNMKELHKTFFKTGVLQIVSARSRPDAFMSDQTANNPQDAHPGIVDIKITKVGILWRKDTKKKKTRSPWQEWGAILTGAQLYFFRNTTWIKHLMHQFEDHVKRGHDGDPCIFKPPLEEFKPDALMSTDGAVALMDSSYKKHKHAFVYVRHGGFEEVLLAEDENEMNDWLAKLNYAAAFRTSGVRMRGVVGANLDGQGRRAIRRLDTGSQRIQTPTGEVSVSRSKIDHKMAQDILAARRAIMLQKIADANEKLLQTEKTLEMQLRNSRHLQILAPIQPKTREQMLLSAARMAAQLKWTRMEIWKLKCHRDILLMDLEEEREMLGMQAETAIGALTPSKEPLTREDTRTSRNSGYPQSPQSPVQSLMGKVPTIVKKPDEDSPQADAIQTPPTSATGPASQQKEVENTDPRKKSVSSAVSSSRSLAATPSRGLTSSGSTSESKFDQDEIDAEEHDLLAQAGLLESARRGSEQRPPSLATDTDGNAQSEKEKHKIRRSFQRTLREGAGHISHHRSRRGRDSASASVVSDEASQEGPDVLVRSTGSFVVHGKKASVINFGTELQLQNMSPEERIRHWKQRDDASIAESNERFGSENGGSRDQAVAEGSDFRSILTARSASHARREHRGSAASASTATAKSFRDLHRKYSASQHATTRSVPPSSANLAIPSDEESDAAVSFSDGRRTPLPPIEGESEPSEGHEMLNMTPPSSSRGENRETVFFTPQSVPVATRVASPLRRGSEEGKDVSSDKDHRPASSSAAAAATDVLQEGEELVVSPPLQEAINA
ncbi:hypothetical protein GE21DRAFT_8031 [Neurospora crassa]|uniref:Protein transport protein sec73 n=1 Tax=Neurospora crassa (strain ATCC 24698 / 74-OR23-1A / CBS 708.71 / DSM 1257 / FGSC 987) TaxID=367110 RepID=V5ILK3_NEUCR|nr:uncharacterized protein NCU01465 [Neurospora crassa OR74A]XP_011394542.1 hypothetical protein NCU01465 [Neurospora crassa OR74A]XP_011394543.1 uncharacterized protein NCU01465 [Neurospora crassa OR74A]KHE83662.1 hypothetical protein GE21DRAFT_8031 [Neurospora crassa]ESA42621.1 hypothetical protein NCU01465 [Neurospora crassa OR74A]ESA42622.1 hypothetical protein, variant 1 [Neurospora crassa OR74A]ESA42623.1 hypothetical protein, variant 2 [Neurospora crassa OR74A]|eukprot:XP_011394541.1 uncharacterized protein NCU01465 [Neurospora crassa OR74A]